MEVWVIACAASALARTAFDPYPGRWDSFASAHVGYDGAVLGQCKHRSGQAAYAQQRIRSGSRHERSKRELRQAGLSGRTGDFAHQKGHGGVHLRSLGLYHCDSSPVVQSDDMMAREVVRGFWRRVRVGQSHAHLRGRLVSGDCGLGPM